MPRKQKPAEVREQAIMLAAGDNQSAAARQLDIEPRTVSRWINAADPALIARYVQEKRARALQVVLERTEAATERMMDAVLTTPITSGKDVQALTTALGILDDHYGGRQAPSGGGRFGTNSLLDGWTERDRVTLERIERLTLEPGQPEPVPDPPGVGKHDR